MHEALGLELAGQELGLLCCKLVPHLVGLGHVNDKLCVLMYTVPLQPSIVYTAVRSLYNVCPKLQLQYLYLQSW